MAVTRLYDSDQAGRSSGESSARLTFQVTEALTAVEANAQLIASAEYNGGVHPDDPGLTVSGYSAVERVGSGTTAGFNITVAYAEPGSGVFSPPPPDITASDYAEWTCSFTTETMEIPIVSEVTVEAVQALPYGAAGPPAPVSLTSASRTDMPFLVGIHRVQYSINILNFTFAHNVAIGSQVDKLHEPFGAGLGQYIFEGGNVNQITKDTHHVEYTWKQIAGNDAIPSLEPAMLPVPARGVNESYVVVKELLSASETGLVITTHNPRAVGTHLALPGLT